MKLELAKTGNHNGITITPEDILDMVNTFSGDVPVTIGHTLDDTMPAYGWVTMLELSEDSATLIGTVELGSDLEKGLADESYKNWSIGAGRDENGRMYLHHVAFLGAVPPMIKDLKMIEMGDTSELVTLTNQSKAKVLLSDTEIAEYSNLKKEKKQSFISKLDEASKGKLPFGKREELLRFADSKLDQRGGTEMVEFLTEIFSSVKPPVREGLSEIFTSKRAETDRSVFSKI